MRAVQSSVDLAAYRQEVVDFLRSGDCAVFLDTNLLAWAFRLNDVASREFTRWLENLAQDERLFIPAWVIHEYNHHLLRDDPTFFLPHKAIGKQLTGNLTELEKVAHLMLSDASAKELGYADRERLFAAFTDASKIIQRCAAHLAKNDAQRRRDLTVYFEALFAKCALKSNVHEIADTAAREAPARYANRLSPGYNDAQKAENASGDFIIWKELLNHCKSKGTKKAVLITNDRKTDWVYTPPSVVLPNGTSISGTNEATRLVKLPKPDLLAEFERHTRSADFRIFSIECVIDSLSSAELNHWDAQDFRQLALAIKLDLARTPTEAVVQWFLKNPEKYKEALRGVCRWEQSPAEVDQKAFERWTVDQMKDVDAENVRWMDVFCELFL